jgi:hypothetical protein
MDESRAVRLSEFLRRLGVLAPAATREEARKQIEDTLTSVENELTTIPSDPTTRGSDGRMYPPEDDAVRDVPDHPEVLRFRSRGHNTYIRSNGAIEVREVRGGRTVFEKPGADGRKVWDGDDQG